MSEFSGVEPYIVWGGGFSEEELDAIVAALNLHDEIDSAAWTVSTTS